MTGESLKELNLFKLRLARLSVRRVLPLNREDSQLMLDIVRAIDALIKLNGGDPDEEL